MNSIRSVDEVGRNANTAAADDASSVADLILIGTGVSTALPQISCVIRAQEMDPQCAVCLAGHGDPLSPNRRCNVSAVLRVGKRTVLIDCGKTMREAALRWFPKAGITGVDAVVLTHGHADAMLGLDDLRDVQKRVQGPSGWEQCATPVFLNEETMDVCQRVFPYLCAELLEKKKNGVKEDTVSRRIAAIDWRPFSDSEYFKPFKPLEDCDVEFIPVPLLHGGDYICMGFVITVRQHGVVTKTVAYLSDVKEVPEKTMDFLEKLQTIDVLIVDALSIHAHPTHFNLAEATEFAKKLKPKVTRCVGMGCRLGLHEDVNAVLEELLITEGLDIQLAHDGLRFPL